MDDMTPTPEDLARDLRQDLKMCSPTLDDLWVWGEDDDAEYINAARFGWGAAIRRALAAEAEVARLRAALERIACRDQGEVGPHMEEPRAAAIAREVLGQ